MDSAERNDLLEKLKLAFKEEQDDAVSLATIIDMYGSQFNEEGSIEDIGEFLNIFYDLLKDNPLAVHEIGWDLPKFLLGFFNEKNIDFNQKLTESVIIKTVMKCMIEIANSGNPKECLLSSCEILAGLDLNEMNDDTNDNSTDVESNDINDLSGDDELKEETTKQKVEEELKEDEYVVKNYVEFIPNLKIHALFQVIMIIVNRIDTLYPSRFISMVFSATVKYFRSNIDLMENPDFILHRIYELCLNFRYSPPKFSKQLEITEDEYNTIVEDEKILCSKALGELVSITIGIGFKNKDLKLDLLYYCSLTDTTLDIELFDEEFTNIAVEYNLLSHVFSIDVKKEFTNYLNEIKLIYEPVTAETSKSEIELNQVVYQLSYTYFLKKALSTNKLEFDKYGIVILSGLYFAEGGKHLLPHIDIADSIYLFLSCSTASLYSETYNSRGMESVCRYCLWVSVTQKDIQKLRTELSQISKVIIKSFLQMLLVKNCTQTDGHVRGVTFTLLTRILCLLPEDISYDFIFETLLTCPYQNAKISMLRILKDLMSLNINNLGSITVGIAKNHHQVNRDHNLQNHIEEDNNLPNISEGIQKLLVSEKPKPPCLPPRQYISITDDRMASIHSLAVMCIERAAKELESGERSNTILLLSYMNFFVGLRNKWNIDLLHVIYEEIESKFSNNDKIADIGTTIPELQFIKIANETLKADLDGVN